MASADLVNVFKPCQFHLEPAKLLEELSIPGGLCLVIAHVVLAKRAAAAIQQLLVPLRNLGRMHRIFADELAELLLLFQRIERNPERDVGAAPLVNAVLKV